MAHGPALTLEQQEVALLFELIETWSLRPEIDALLLAFSFWGALRVGEIANLTPDAVLDPRGNLCEVIRITFTKGRRGRTIFMHPEIRALLQRFFAKHRHSGWFAVSPRDGRQMSPAALGMHFKRIYDELGFIGCTSHSGRATCITELARRAGEFGCSLEDVKRFAGHKHLSSTERYLRPSERGRELVHALGRGFQHHPFNQQRRKNHGRKGSTWNNRHADAETVYRDRQHEAWVAQQFIHTRLQSEQGAERSGVFGRPY